MIETVYSLENRKRILKFPYVLREIGWMPNHRIRHRNNRLPYTFFCVIFRKKQMTLCMLPHGTVLNAPMGPQYDELFFGYSPEVGEQLFHVFGTSTPFSRTILPGEREQYLIREIRENLNSIAEPGTADRLDRLAFALICELATQSECSEEERNMKLLIHEIAIAMEKGKPLSKLIPSFGFSRRNFYREWNKVFSISPVQYILERKLARAEGLLMNKKMNIKQIALECGFSTPSYFGMLFKRSRGISPLVRREKSFNLK